MVQVAYRDFWRGSAWRGMAWAPMVQWWRIRDLWLGLAGLGGARQGKARAPTVHFNL